MRRPLSLLAAVLAAAVLVFTISIEHARAQATAEAAVEWLKSIPAVAADNLEQKIAAPFDFVPTRATSTTVSNVSWAEFPAADISTKMQRTDVVQLLTVVNFSASARICVDFVNRDTNNDGVMDIADCAANPGCAGLTTTCSGASTDADIVLAGVPRTWTVSGTMCLCFMSSAANGSAQLSEVVR